MGEVAFKDFVKKLFVKRGDLLLIYYLILPLVIPHQENRVLDQSRSGVLLDAFLLDE
jgi:hypothetical protein